MKMMMTKNFELQMTEEQVRVLVGITNKFMERIWKPETEFAYDKEEYQFMSSVVSNCESMLKP